MTNGQKMFVSFIVGAAAGVVAGLLFAPKSGKETRQKIAKKASEIKDALETRLKSFKKEEIY